MFSKAASEISQMEGPVDQRSLITQPPSCLLGLALTWCHKGHVPVLSCPFVSRVSISHLHDGMFSYQLVNFPTMQRTTEFSHWKHIFPRYPAWLLFLRVRESKYQSLLLLILSFSSSFLFALSGIEFSVSHLQGKCSTTEPHLQITVMLLILTVEKNRSGLLSFWKKSREEWSGTLIFGTTPPGSTPVSDTINNMALAHDLPHFLSCLSEGLLVEHTYSQNCALWVHH